MFPVIRRESGAVTVKVTTLLVTLPKGLVTTTS